MNRIIVIGCPGSGKSTFSKALHKITNIPLYHLDMMYWNYDRTTVEQSVFLKLLSNTMKKSQWIIDGNYQSTLELRLQVCDTVIFLDYPVDVCLNGIAERKGKARTDIPWVEPENQEDNTFIDFVKSYNSQSRPKVIWLLNKYSNKDIYIFKQRKDSDEFLNKLK